MAPSRQGQKKRKLKTPQKRKRETRRNRGFEETHAALIEASVRIVSERGVDALTIAALARATGIHRTAVYYHFDDRDALIKAVKVWSSEQLAKAFVPVASQEERIDYVTRFVLTNPELINLWIEDFVSKGDIRDRYPRWDVLVEGIRSRFANDRELSSLDAEAWCVMLLVGAFIAPRVFRNSVRPNLDIEAVISRFRALQLHMLTHDALARV
jgi:AcrR family transcriptional regulator